MIDPIDIDFLRMRNLAVLASLEERFGTLGRIASKIIPTPAARFVPAPAEITWVDETAHVGVVRPDPKESSDHTVIVTRWLPRERNLGKPTKRVMVTGFGKDGNVSSEVHSMFLSTSFVREATPTDIAIGFRILSETLQ